jgi:hypothetical protein
MNRGRQWTPEAGVLIPPSVLVVPPMFLAVTSWSPTKDEVP